MDLSNYEVGQWIPDLGKYKKICALKECQRPFAGRHNKHHCTNPCKTKKNNDRGRIRRALSKRFNDETYRANNTFLKFLKDEEGINEVSKTELMKNGFDGNSPSKNIKDDRFHGSWISIGSFAYRVKENDRNIIEFIYLKNEELRQ